MPDMKTIVISERSKFRTLHVEAPGCIVNIHFGLHDREGRSVTNISITPDQYSGEQQWTTHTIERTTSGCGVRVVQETLEEKAERRAIDRAAMLAGTSY